MDKQRIDDDYTLKTLSIRSQRSIPSIRRDIRKGAIQAFKVGGSIRIRYDEGERYSLGTEIKIQ